MNGIPPNPMLGVFMHSIGATLAANCYSPQKYIRLWSWEIFWMTQAAWCWFLWPIIGAALTIPDLLAVLREAPKSIMLLSFAMGMAYGVGGTAFNISIRYIGFSLTYSIAVGLSSVLGTLIPPLVRGQAASIISKPGSSWVLAGVAVGTLGIAACGLAGRNKEKDLQASVGGTGEFSMIKGLLLSLLAGVLSAVYGFALEVAQPIVEIAAEHGAGHWKGNVAYLFANTGAFVTALLYSLYLARKNRTLHELTGVNGGTRTGLVINYVLAILTGALWYGQFFFYNLGHVRMGNYAFTSWAIHMIMLVLISNLVAVLFQEWKGCRPKTHRAIGFGLVLLLAAVLSLTYGNYLGDLKN
jgi:L-rhamnose-H+ transport protein